jgi:fused signal recognition particle receptor
LFDILKKKISGFTNKIFNKVKKDESKDITQDKQPTQEKASDTSSVLEDADSKKIVNTTEDVIDANKFPENQKTNFNEDLLDDKKQSLDNQIEEPLESKPLDISKPKVKDQLPLEDVQEKEIVQKPKDIKDQIEIEPQKKKIDDNLIVDKKKHIKKTVFKSFKNIFHEKIKISEKEISGFLEEFELSLLEADVSIDSAQSIISDLQNKLTQEHFSKKNLLEDIKKAIRKSLLEQLNIDCDINNYITNQKPFVIMFVGPNGAGKTTTIAKFGKMFNDAKKKVLFSSSDTFRAGSIQQLEKHAQNLGIKVIKQNYGSDPAAVAYDAVASAKANNVDFVLIDTAGRQETNINLMQELKKIRKVVSPNLVIYIGESQSGQTIVDQVSKFKDEIGLDGVILTKLDTDPKGGVAISIINSLKLPIFFIGTGQEYDDLLKFSPKVIVDRIVE